MTALFWLSPATSQTTQVHNEQCPPLYYVRAVWGRELRRAERNWLASAFSDDWRGWTPLGLLTGAPCGLCLELELPHSTAASEQSDSPCGHSGFQDEHLHQQGRGCLASADLALKVTRPYFRLRSIRWSSTRPTRVKGAGDTDHASWRAEWQGICDCILQQPQVLTM